jgi:hypothetical protein
MKHRREYMDSTLYGLGNNWPFCAFDAFILWETVCVVCAELDFTQSIIQFVSFISVTHILWFHPRDVQYSRIITARNCFSNHLFLSFKMKNFNPKSV